MALEMKIKCILMIASMTLNRVLEAFAYSALDDAMDSKLFSVLYHAVFDSL